MANGGVCRSNVPGSHPSIQAFPTDWPCPAWPAPFDWLETPFSWSVYLVLLPYQMTTDHFLILILYCRGQSKGIKQRIPSEARAWIMEVRGHLWGLWKVPVKTTGGPRQDTLANSVLKDSELRETMLIRQPQSTTDSIFLYTCMSGYCHVPGFQTPPSFSLSYFEIDRRAWNEANHVSLCVCMHAGSHLKKMWEGYSYTFTSLPRTHMRSKNLHNNAKSGDLSIWAQQICQNYR